MEMPQVNSLYSYLKQTKCLFIKKQDRKVNRSAWGLASAGGRGYKEKVYGGECGGSICV
jgi:hypothetical protein